MEKVERRADQGARHLPATVRSPFQLKQITGCKNDRLLSFAGMTFLSRLETERMAAFGEPDAGTQGRWYIPCSNSPVLEI